MWSTMIISSYAECLLNSSYIKLDEVDNEKSCQRETYGNAENLGITAAADLDNKVIAFFLMNVRNELRKKLDELDKAGRKVKIGANNGIEKKELKFKDNTQIKRYNILIAEDESMNFEVLQVLIKFVLDLKCNLFHAKNGQEAVEICKSRSDIDIILMDIRMPILTGLEATRKIRKISPEIPIVAQTAFHGEIERENALNAGCNDFITKPIKKDVLKTVLAKYLR